MKEKIISNLIVGVFALAIAGLFVLVLTIRERPLGQATPGIPATLATSSISVVGTTASRVFATSTCTSRIITTAAKPVMLTFSDLNGYTPTGAFGHLQAASTTVSYDSGLYGCDAVKIFGFDSNTTITVSEFR